MATYIALLRGINVGGNTLLPMKELSALCLKLGFKDVQTYINSGNVIFESDLTQDQLRIQLQNALLKQKGKAITVMVRSASELQKLIIHNPFPEAIPSQVGVILLNEAIPKTFAKDFADLKNTGPELVVPGRREIFVHYVIGMGRSTLKLPALAQAGTMRNINTISKLVALTKGV